MRAQKAEENVDYIYLGGYTEDTPPIYASSGLLQGLERTWTTYGGCRGI